MRQKSLWLILFSFVLMVGCGNEDDSNNTPKPQVQPTQTTTKEQASETEKKLAAKKALASKGTPPASKSTPSGSSQTFTPTQAKNSNPYIPTAHANIRPPVDRHMNLPNNVAYAIFEIKSKDDQNRMLLKPLPNPRIHGIRIMMDRSMKVTPTEAGLQRLKRDNSELPLLVDTEKRVYLPCELKIAENSVVDGIQPADHGNLFKRIDPAQVDSLTNEAVEIKYCQIERSWGIPRLDQIRTEISDQIHPGNRETLKRLSQVALDHYVKTENDPSMLDFIQKFPISICAMTALAVTQLDFDAMGRDFTDVWVAAGYRTGGFIDFDGRTHAWNLFVDNGSLTSADYTAQATPSDLSSLTPPQIKWFEDRVLERPRFDGFDSLLKPISQTDIRTLRDEFHKKRQDAMNDSIADLFSAGNFVSYQGSWRTYQDSNSQDLFTVDVTRKETGLPSTVRAFCRRTHDAKVQLIDFDILNQSLDDMAGKDCFYFGVQGTLQAKSAYTHNFTESTKGNGTSILKTGARDISHIEALIARFPVHNPAKTLLAIREPGPCEMGTHGPGFGVYLSNLDLLSWSHDNDHFADFLRQPSESELQQFWSDRSLLLENFEIKMEVNVYIADE